MVVMMCGPQLNPSLCAARLPQPVAAAGAVQWVRREEQERRVRAVRSAGSRQNLAAAPRGARASCLRLSVRVVQYRATGQGGVPHARAPGRRPRAVQQRIIRTPLQRRVQLRLASWRPRCATERAAAPRWVPKFS